MTATVFAKDQQGLPARFGRCISKLGRLLVPPFAAMPGNEFVDTIKNETGAEAVSVFLVSEDEPNKLFCAAGVGYKPEYHNNRYFLNGRFLTSFVYRERRPINASLEELQRSRKDFDENKGGIPFAGRCRLFIESGEFFNIIAVPILFQDKCLGVLKLENKGESPAERFPDEDFALAELLASIIAVAHQQRIYAKLWSEIEQIKKHSRSLNSYAQNATRILAGFLNAECASIFVRTVSEDGKLVLKYAGGVGYKENYKEHIYELNKESLTTHIAITQAPIIKTEEDIIKEKLPYTGACIRYIASGTFRNIIGMPLMSEPSGELLGVLKIENKRPEHLMFDNHDNEICEAFTNQQIIPILSQFMSDKNGHFPSTTGFSLLVNKLGHSERRKGEALLDIVKKVKALKKKEASITGDDCAAYLQISKPHFYRLVKEVK